MPKLSFGGGQLMVSFYESRGKIAANNGNEFFDYEAIEIGPQELAGEFWMSGYDRVVDLRAALLDPQTGGLESSSIQVSRYPISGSAKPRRRLSRSFRRGAHQPAVLAGPRLPV